MSRSDSPPMRSALGECTICRVPHAAATGCLPVELKLEIAKLRRALNHAVYRTHEDTDWCSGCKDIRDSAAVRP